MNYNGEAYDAVGRRKNQELFLIAGGNKVIGPPAAGSKAGGAASAVKSTGLKPSGGMKSASTVSTSKKNPIAGSAAVSGGNSEQTKVL